MDRARSPLEFAATTIHEPEAARLPFADDIREEAVRVTAAAAAAHLGLRLMGGLAVWMVCPSARAAPFAREYADLDFAVRKQDARAVTAFLAREGYEPERMFNSIHGAQRLNFGHPEGRWTIDVVVDALRMSHLVDLSGRLEPGPPTIDLADLLITKLQVWEINAKDLGDIACLLADHQLAERGAGEVGIDLQRVLALTGDDWGLCHTLERNLRQVADFARGRRPPDAPLDPIVQAEALLGAIGAGRKSMAWRLRARIGERMRWYETPEEVRH
jgi:hypothetical protein